LLPCQSAFQVTGISYDGGYAEYMIAPAAELLKLGGARVILATATDNKAMSATLGGLGVNGKLIIVGVATEPLQVPTILLIMGRRSIMGWPSGSPIDSQDALNFCVLSGVRAMTQLFPLEKAAEAYELMMSGKARFRAVLTTAPQSKM